MRLTSVVNYSTSVNFQFRIRTKISYNEMLYHYFTNSNRVGGFYVSRMSTDR